MSTSQVLHVDYMLPIKNRMIGTVNDILFRLCKHHVIMFACTLIRYFLIFPSFNDTMLITKSRNLLQSFLKDGH